MNANDAYINLTKEVARLTKERDEAQRLYQAALDGLTAESKERAKAQAKCAELRDLLKHASGEVYHNAKNHLSSECPGCAPRSEINTALLSSDCGKGWKSPEEYAALESKCAALAWDIDAYRGALGYSVPADHTGNLRDGTMPKCGICNSDYHKNLEAKCAEMRRVIEQAANQLKRGEWDSHTSGTWQMLNDALKP